MAARLSLAILLSLLLPVHGLRVQGFLTCFAADENDDNVERLIGMLSDESADLRVQALRELYELGDEASDACSRIGELLDDPDALVRRDALLAAAAVCPDPPELAPRVVKVFVDQDIAFFEANADIQCVVLRALPRFGTDLLPVLAAAAKQGVPGLEKKTIAGYRQAKVAIFEEDNGDDCQVRREACIALGKLKDPRGAAVLLKVLESAERTRPARDPVGRFLTKGRPPRWGQRHTLVVQSILVALGEIPSDDPKVAMALKKHARRFPRDTDAALRKIAKRKEQN